jgi:Ca2+-binding RTX toxin-like protein
VQDNGAGDTVFAGPGGLTYQGGAGFDTVVGGGNPLTITGGTGGGAYFGGGNAVITAGAGGLEVEVGGNGDQLYAAGNTGVLFGTVGGNTLMSSAQDTGTSVFFGTGTMTFITGAGNDLLALGQGTNIVTLGSGHDVIFGNGGNTSVSTITAGSGSLDLAFSGASTVLNIASGAARSFGLYNFVPNADTIHLTGYSDAQAATAIANQKQIGGGTQLFLNDGSVISLIGVARASSSLFS